MTSVLECFVIMPFGQAASAAGSAYPSAPIYEHWIKPTVEGIRLDSIGARIACHRADRTLGPGEIASDVARRLVGADLVIADLTGSNANVLYELGIRHGAGGSALLLTQDADSTPFDLRGLRLLTYRYDPESMLALRRSLEQAVRELLLKPHSGEHAVMRALRERGQPTPVHSAQPGATVRPESAELAKLEGAWRSLDNESRYYAKIHDGTLRIPYAYGKSETLSAHMFELRKVDELLVGRFEWFSAPAKASGRIVLRMLSPHMLDGWWWHEERLDQLGSGDPDRMRPHRLRLARSPAAEPMPSWAAQYFRRRADR